MPYTRKMNPAELSLYAVSDPSLTPARIAEIEIAVARGAALVMECSSMSDAHEYTRVLLDGKQIAYAEGY